MRRSFALAASTAMALTLASAASAAAPPTRIYDCYRAGGSLGLTYVQAVQLKTRSRYLVAPFRRGSQLSGRAAPGRYRVSGARIAWLTGPYAQFIGVFHAKTATSAAYIELDNRRGSWTGVSCYPH